MRFCMCSNSSFVIDKKSASFLVFVCPADFLSDFGLIRDLESEIVIQADIKRFAPF